MIKTIGCYVRLSQADDKADESNSIINQRTLIHNYIDNHPDLQGRKIIDYVDDGYTGTNMDRPEFQRMIRMAQCGQIQCIIVKDFSRFARHYIAMGDYVEQILPELGIRFISVTDHYDSAVSLTSSDNLSMALKSVLNSYYSRELSSKMTSYFMQRMRDGTYTGKPCFGYTMDQEHTHFVVDPEAAKIVRLIYDMALAGKTRPEIANYLNDQGLPTPAVYKSQRGFSPKGLITANPLWDHVKVTTILRQEIYTGKLIMRKRTQTAPCSRKYHNADSAEHIVRNNAHEAIITQEEFDRVQELMPKQKGWNRKNQKQYPLKKLVRCGTCRKCMTYRNKDSGAAFVCPDCYIKHSPCSKKRYPMHEIEQVLLCTIQQHLKLVMQEEDIDAETQRNQYLATYERELGKYLAEKDYLIQKKSQCFERYHSGAITLEQYICKKDAYAKKSQALEIKIADLEKKRAALEVSSTCIQTAFGTPDRTVGDFLEAQELTREMAVCFVKSIYLYETHMEIEWKYRDIFKSFLAQGDTNECNRAT